LIRLRNHSAAEAPDRPAAQGSVVVARLVAEGPASLHLAQQELDGVFEISPPTKELVTNCGDLFVRQGRHKVERIHRRENGPIRRQGARKNEPSTQSFGLPLQELGSQEGPTGKEPFLPGLAALDPLAVAPRRLDEA
jgi:hypothetical protein